MAERGVIRNREYKLQINDFSKLRFGNITPTDIDAFMDFSDKLFVFVEAKFGSAPMPRGQEWAIERLVDATHCPPKRHSVAFITSHKVESGDVDFANTVVTKYRWCGKWRYPKTSGSTLLEGITAIKAAVMPSNVIPLRKSEK